MNLKKWEEGKNVFVNGRYYDILFMDILKEEFDEKGKIRYKE